MKSLPRSCVVLILLQHFPQPRQVPHNSLLTWVPNISNQVSTQSTT